MNFELGRLNFEDERRWWWDDELDALRVSYERGEVELSLAVARERGRNRSDQSRVDPDHNGVRRWIAHAAWEWQHDLAVNLFMLRRNDQSNTEPVGQTALVSAQDDSDARLTVSGIFMFRCSRMCRSTNLLELATALSCAAPQAQPTARSGERTSTARSTRDC